MSLSLQSGTRWFKGIPDNRVWWLLTVKICWITKFGFKGKLFLLATNLVFAFFLENVSEATRPGEIKMICLSLPHYRTFTLHRFLNENCPTNKIIGHSKFCCKYKIPVISCLPGLVWNPYIPFLSDDKTSREHAFFVQLLYHFTSPFSKFDQMLPFEYTQTLVDRTQGCNLHYYDVMASTIKTLIGGHPRN